MIHMAAQWLQCGAPVLVASVVSVAQASFPLPLPRAPLSLPTPSLSPAFSHAYKPPSSRLGMSASCPSGPIFGGHLSGRPPGLPLRASRRARSRCESGSCRAAGRICVAVPCLGRRAVRRPPRDKAAAGGGGVELTAMGLVTATQARGGTWSARGLVRRGGGVDDGSLDAIARVGPAVDWNEALVLEPPGAETAEVLLTPRCRDSGWTASTRLVDLAKRACSRRSQADALPLRLIFRLAKTLVTYPRMDSYSRALCLSLCGRGQTQEYTLRETILNSATAFLPLLATSS